jgi:hypothetical protein
MSARLDCSIVMYITLRCLQAAVLDPVEAEAVKASWSTWVGSTSAIIDCECKCQTLHHSRAVASDSKNFSTFTSSALPPGKPISSNLTLSLSPIVP